MMLNCKEIKDFIGSITEIRLSDFFLLLNLVYLVESSYVGQAFDKK
jgi:hypothetical protein